MSFTSLTSFSSHITNNANKKTKSLWKKNDNSVSKFWNSINISDDGTKMIASCEPGNTLYKSIDSGLTWTSVGDVVGSSNEWRCVCQSNDGVRLAAGIATGLLYKSTNSGTNWISLGLSQRWLGSYVSSDGNTFIFASYSGGLYMSTNVTTEFTFTLVPNSVSINYVGVWISNNKQIIYAINETVGLYYTFNGGTTWNQKNINGLYCIDASTDGSRVIFGGDDGKMYISTNSLSSYSEISISTPTPFRRWRSAASSGDGKILICSNCSDFVFGNTSIHVSIDSGVTWTTELIPKYPSIAVKCSRDGKYLVVAFYGEYIYTRQMS